MDIYKIFTSKIPRTIEDFDPRNKKLITFLNPHSYTLAFKRAELFEDFDFIAPDGILIVHVLNLFKAVTFKIKRFSCDMTSVVPYVFNIAIADNLSVFFLGTDESGIEGSVNVFRNNFPALNIAGFRKGYFSSKVDRDEAIDHIVKLNPDMIFVGMGTILQESMVLDLRKAGYDGAVYTCGGFLHQSKLEINFYPQFIDKLNLRFFYRMFREKGFLKRSIKTYPMFCYLILTQLFNVEKQSDEVYINDDLKIAAARKNIKVVSKNDDLASFDSDFCTNSK